MQAVPDKGADLLANIFVHSAAALDLRQRGLNPAMGQA